MKEHLKLPLYRKRIFDSEEATTPIGYCVCDINGEFITQCLPESVCNEIVHICNTHHRKDVLKKRTPSRTPTQARLVIYGEPMVKPDAKSIAKDKEGNWVVADSPTYVAYMKQFRQQTFEERNQYDIELPFKSKIQITAVFYLGENIANRLSQYVDGLMDCLLYSGIINSATNRVVNNFDGSRIYVDMKRPRIEVFIKKWE